MARVSQNQQAGAFKPFPEFSALTFGHRKMYESIVARYPPIAGISFPDLMTWWSPLSSCMVAELNGNLVVSYWLPGGEQYSGFSLIGTSDIDESFCAIFDYLRQTGEPPRVVRVPEFVLAHVHYPELFVCKEEREFGEYIYDISKFYPLDHLISYRRHRVRKFLSQVNEDRIVVKSLDLSERGNQRLLLEHGWQNAGINKVGQVEEEAIEASIQYATLLGEENLCLYIDDELKGYCLYHQPADKRYIIIKHAKVDYEMPRILDYMTYAFAAWYADKGVMYANPDADLGLAFLRMFKLALGPSNFFRKYTVEPR